MLPILLLLAAAHSPDSVDQRPTDAEIRLAVRQLDAVLLQFQTALGSEKAKEFIDHETLAGSAEQNAGLRLLVSHIEKDQEGFSAGSDILLICSLTRVLMQAVGISSMLTAQRDVLKAGDPKILEIDKLRLDFLMVVAAGAVPLNSLESLGTRAALNEEEMFLKVSDILKKILDIDTTDAGPKTGLSL